MEISRYRPVPLKRRLATQKDQQAAALGRRGSELGLQKCSAIHIIWEISEDGSIDTPVDISNESIIT